MHRLIEAEWLVGARYIQQVRERFEIFIPLLHYQGPSLSYLYLNQGVELRHNEYFYIDSMAEQIP